jgi:hypothetical protein
MDAGIRRNAGDCLGHDEVTDYGPIIKAALLPHREKRGQALAIPCPICGGNFHIEVSTGGKIKGTCRPTPTGPYCISYIE